jgi:hypothetical protein
MGQKQLVLPSSDGFPEGLLDQPFYGWVEVASTTSPF